MTFMTLCRLLCLSSYYFCCIWRLSPYDVCHLWRLSPYTFVAYDVCRLITCVAYDFCSLWCLSLTVWLLSLMRFVALWRLSHMTFVTIRRSRILGVLVCRLWRLSQRQKIFAFFCIRGLSGLIWRCALFSCDFKTVWHSVTLPPFQDHCAADLNSCSSSLEHQLLYR